MLYSTLKSIVYRFNFMFFKRKNDVFSQNVSLPALAGVNIEIREGTYIDGSSVVGSYTYVGRNCAITKSSIGRYCSIANNVSIGQGEHELDRISTSSIFYDASYEMLTNKECNIGDDVWIGVDAIILCGVSIGIGAVIGANSVVTKDVPPFAIVVGSPARIIKYRFDTDKADSILNSQWWDNPPEKAKSIFIELGEK